VRGELQKSLARYKVPRRIEFDLKLARVDDHLAEGGGGVDPWPDDDFWEWWI